MAAGLDPEATVVAAGALEREPKAGHRDRFGLEIGRVLMPADLAADARLFEDVHRLIELGRRQSEVVRDRLETRIVGKALENGMEIGDRVAYLFDREPLRLAQRARLVEGFLFEETTNLVARCQEILVRLRALVARAEDRDRLGIKPFDDLFRPSAQRRNLCGRLEVGDQQEPVVFEAAPLRGAQIRRRVRHQNLNSGWATLGRASAAARATAAQEA